MNRRVWTGTCASVIASMGLAAGQTPPSTAMDGASTGVVTLRTAGQPDRKLQVLKCEKMPDGKILTEVKDLATGAVFTIADTKPFAGIEATPAGKPANLPVMAPAPQSQQSHTLPGTTIPAASSQLPTARSRTNDPLMPGSTVPATVATQSRPQSRYENTAPPQTEYPTLMGKLRGNSANAAPVQPPVTNAPPKQSAMSAALFGSYSTQPQEQPTLVGKYTEPKMMTANAPMPPTSGGGIKTALFGSPNQTAVAQETPTLMGKLFGDKPTPITTTPMTVTQAPARVGNNNIIRPNAIANSNSRIMPPAPTGSAALVAQETKMSVAMEPKMTPITVTAPTPAMPGTTSNVQTASYAPVSTDARDPHFHVKPAAPMTMKQIEDQVKELRMNQRPSKRMEAATMLATGPMANMVEVRQVLAEATYRDPVGVVRAHCIDLLSKMKYDEYNYKQYLDTLVNDDEPAVQRAARAAVK